MNKRIPSLDEFINESSKNVFDFNGKDYQKINKLPHADIYSEGSDFIRLASWYDKFSIWLTNDGFMGIEMKQTSDNTKIDYDHKTKDYFLDLKKSKFSYTADISKIKKIDKFLDYIRKAKDLDDIKEKMKDWPEYDKHMRD